MAKKKDTVINIRPFHAELKNVRLESFEIWFYDRVGDDYQRRKIVKVHFRFYWLRFLSSMLWKVQKNTQKIADEQARELRGDL